MRTAEKWINACRGDGRIESEGAGVPGKSEVAGWVSAAETGNVNAAHEIAIRIANSLRSAVFVLKNTRRIRPCNGIARQHNARGASLIVKVVNIRITRIGTLVVRFLDFIVVLDVSARIGHLHGATLLRRNLQRRCGYR